MSLLELLVVLHLGSTAGLLVVLGVVIALQRARSLVARGPAAAPAQASEHQVVLGLDPRPADRRLVREPGVTGAARRSS